jgi:hypothetical protein
MPPGPQGLPTGSYTLTADYGGDENSGSSAGTAPLRVSPAPTSTRLTLSAGSVPFGLENSETLTVQVGTSIGGIGGTVSIVADGDPLCTGLIVTTGAGSASCTLTPSELPVGTFQVSAHYDGQPGFASSDSPPQTLTVSKRPWGCFQTARNETGPDQYQVRRYDTRYQHITLTRLAHAFLSVTAAIVPAASSRSCSARSAVS